MHQPDADHIAAVLGGHGFAEVDRTDRHVLLRRGGRRVVVPRGTALPGWIVRAIEWQLEPELGAGWMSSTRPGGAVEREPVALVAVTRDGDEGSTAFLLDEPAVASFGPTRGDALANVADAAALWFGRPVRVVPVDPAPIDAGPVDAGRVDAAPRMAS